MAVEAGTRSVGRALLAFASAMALTFIAAGCSARSAANDVTHSIAVDALDEARNADARVEELEAQVSDLENTISDLEERLEQLENAN